LFNCLLLPLFCASAEKYDQGISMLAQVNPISGTIVESNLLDALTNGLVVTQIAQANLGHSFINQDLGSLIGQVIEPLLKGRVS
jgi:hypothetical protein